MTTKDSAVELIQPEPQADTAEPPRAAAEKIPAVESLVRILVGEGVRYFFGIPGSHTSPLFDEIGRSKQIKVILPKHEQGGAYMADGYARVARGLGVCSGTVGPGATNLITAVAASYADGIPLLVLTGQVPGSGTGRTAHQESTGIGRTPNQVELFRNVTKASFAPTRASQIPQLMRTAVRVALADRFGPVNVTIPCDLYYDKVPNQDIDRRNYRVTRSDNVDLGLVRQAAALIRKAKHPLIIAGQRCLFPDATPQLRALVERFNIPVVTPLNAKGALDERHPLALGCLGLLGQRSAEKYLRELADCVIAVGENFEEWMTLSWDPEIVKDKHLIHIDVDPLEIGKNYPVTVGIDGTIRRVLESLLEELNQLGHEPRRSAEDIERQKEEWEYFTAPEIVSDSIPLKPQRVMHELNKALAPETIVFGDSGHTVRWFGRFFKSAPQTFFAANLFEPMGYGVAACLGGKLAAPDRPVVSICGDGSFLMNGMEISTAVNHDIPVVWLLINDGRLNMVHHMQSCYFDEPVATTFKNPDYVKFAEAFDALGYRVEKPNEIVPAVRAAVASGRPAIVDIHIDPDEIPPMRPRALLVGKESRLGSPRASQSSVRTLMKMMKEK